MIEVTSMLQNASIHTHKYFWDQNVYCFHFWWI